MLFNTTANPTNTDQSVIEHLNKSTSNCVQPINSIPFTPINPALNGSQSVCVCEGCVPVSLPPQGQRSWRMSGVKSPGEERASALVGWRDDGGMLQQSDVGCGGLCRCDRPEDFIITVQ